MIRKILNYVSKDGWKWAVVVFALCALATAGNLYLVTRANTEAVHRSFGLNDCLLEMEEIDHALEQLGAGEVDQARWTLETRLDSVRAKITAQQESSDATDRAMAVMGLIRVAQSQQAHPDYYSSGWRTKVSDVEEQTSARAKAKENN